MKVSKPAVDIQILPSEFKDRFILRYACGDTAVTVAFPHPRESIWLKRDGIDLKREFFPLTWEKPPPRRLEPSQELLASVRLIPYWSSVEGQVLVECEVEWRVAGTQNWSITHVKQQLHLALPTHEELKQADREAVRSGRITPDDPPIQVVEILD